jgi:ArsR family transcriptional regulator, cadmium/lead-responsive transcriptional repressor
VTRPLRDEDELLIAVADPVRRTIIDVVLDRGEASVSTLSRSVPVTRQAVSKHLAVLERVGLVTPHRHGREVRYSVRTDRVTEAARSMLQLANAWDQRLHRIKRIAESLHREAQMQSRNEWNPTNDGHSTTAVQEEA